MNVLRRTSSESRCTKPGTLWHMAEGRFASVCSVEEFIFEQDKKNTATIWIPRVQRASWYVLHKTASGVEYLELYERQTKTRSGSDYSDLRAVPPKMIATDGTVILQWFLKLKRCSVSPEVMLMSWVAAVQSTLNFNITIFKSSSRVNYYLMILGFYWKPFAVIPSWEITSPSIGFCQFLLMNICHLLGQNKESDRIKISWTKFEWFEPTSISSSYSVIFRVGVVLITISLASLWCFYFWLIRCFTDPTYTGSIVVCGLFHHCISRKNDSLEIGWSNLWLSVAHNPNSLISCSSLK